METAYKWSNTGNNYKKLEEEYNEGLRYLKGNGVKKDVKKGISMIKTAADNGYPDAMYHYSKIISIKQKGPNDQDEAVRYLMRAAENGHADAMFVLGKIYYQTPEGNTNNDIIQNRAKGLEYITRAAEEGHKHAKLYLKHGITGGVRRKHRTMRIKRERRNKSTRRNLKK